MSVFSSNAGIYVPEKTPYSDTFHAVIDAINLILILFLQTCYDALNSRIYKVAFFNECKRNLGQANLYCNENVWVPVFRANRT